MNFIPQTSEKQLIYTYKVEKNVSTTAFNTQYYPTSRPMKHYRKQGVHSALPRTFENKAGFINDNIDEPNKCDLNCSRSKEVGLPIKMLAKDVNTKKVSRTYCEDTQGPIGPNGPATSSKGNIMSFSGNAKIKSSIQPNNSYYTESYSYLKSRGNTFNAKNNFRGTPIASPDGSYYELQEGLPRCSTSPSYIKTTYKPNNINFATQGAVSSDTRLQRLKHNTIKKNNLSYVKPYKTVIYYSSDPVFFEKNKVDNCDLKKCYDNPTTPARQAAFFN
jgi:hypothetical protein